MSSVIAAVICFARLAGHRASGSELRNREFSMTKQCTALLISGFLTVVLAGTTHAQAPRGAQAVEPLAATAPTQELATYMSQLQVYAHKLSLSVDAHNRELAAFYLHESEALLQDMQSVFPEYEGVPVALYIDRLALPATGALRQHLAAPGGELDWQAASNAMDEVLSSCNSCHQSSRRGYIKIKRSGVNPYLQDFTTE
jgi:hypothetical protein